jgi:ketosteroid isomerase-like protein
MKTPSIIAAFVKAKNDRDTNAVVACFARDAVVHDEGKKMTGLTAITKWSDEGFKKYQYTIDPTDIAKGDKETILTATLTGNFPGSPVSLDFRFTIKNDKIGGLTIG